MDLIKDIRDVRNVIDGYAKKHASEGHTEKANRNAALVLELELVCAQLGEINDALAGILPDGTTVARVRHLAKCYRDLADETHDGAVAIYERLRDSPIRCRPLRIDGNGRELGEDVVSFIDAAEKMVEGRDVVSLATFHRVEAERDMAVALVKSESERIYSEMIEEVKHEVMKARAAADAEVAALREQVATQQATIATLTAERDSLVKQRTELEKAWDGADRISDGLRTDVERLTKERNEALTQAMYRGHELDGRNAAIDQLTADNARHLETIRALRSFVDRAFQLDWYRFDAGKLLTSTSAYELAESPTFHGLNASDGYEQADDSVIVGDDEHLDLHFGAGCGSKADDVKGGG